MTQRTPSIRNPGTAAVLSAIAPGIGQLYNGKFWRAAFWLVITPGFFVFTAGTFSWPFHILSAITAYNYAKRNPYR